MKALFLGFILLLMLKFLNSCASSESIRSLANTEPMAQPQVPALAPLEKLDLQLLNQQKEVAKLAFNDSETGLTVTFIADKLEKGQYVLQVNESCTKTKPQKKKLPNKLTKVILGEFRTESGNTSSEFSKSGYSIGERFTSISGKAVSLNKRSAKGTLTQVACSIIIKQINPE